MSRKQDKMTYRLKDQIIGDIDLYCVQISQKIPDELRQKVIEYKKRTNQCNLGVGIDLGFSYNVIYKIISGNGRLKISTVNEIDRKLKERI